MIDRQSRSTDGLLSAGLRINETGLNERDEDALDVMADAIADLLVSVFLAEQEESRDKQNSS